MPWIHLFGSNERETYVRIASTSPFYEHMILLVLESKFGLKKISYKCGGYKYELFLISFEY